MATKKIVMETSGVIDDKAEETAAKAKRKTRGAPLKSGKYGARNVKTTFMAPRALLDDAKAVLAATGASMGDVLNKALEDYVRRHPEELEKGREIISGYDN